MKELYWQQFGGGPDAKLLDRMNPEKKFAGAARREDRKRHATKETYRSKGQHDDKKRKGRK